MLNRFLVQSALVTFCAAVFVLAADIYFMDTSLSAVFIYDVPVTNASALPPRR